MSWVVPWQLGTTGTSILSTTTNIPCSPNGLRCTKYNFDILWQSWTFVACVCVPGCEHFHCLTVEKPHDLRKTVSWLAGNAVSPIDDNMKTLDTTNC